MGFEVEVSTTNLELLLCYLDPNWMKVIVMATPANKVRQIDGKINLEIVSPCILVWWSLYKYKCLWGVGGKDKGLSPQERVSHIYTFRLD